MSHISLIPNKERIEAESQRPLLDQLKKQGIILNSSCGGHGSCGDCKVKIIKGYDNLTPPTYEEIKLLGNIFHLTQERLACQIKVLGDVEIDVAAHLQTKQRKPKKQITQKTKIRKPSTKVVTENNFEKKKPEKEQPLEKQGGFSRPKRKF